MSKKPKVRQRGKSGRAQKYAMSHTSFPVPTMAEFYATKTRKGGWTAETLARWGIPYPWPKGWRARLEELVQAGHTQWRGWYLDQQAPATKRAVHSVDAILRGMMGMGT